MYTAVSTVIIRRVNHRPATMDSPAVYRISVEGRVPIDWSNRLLGMNITDSPGAAGNARTVLVGRVPDQAAFCGLLNTLYEEQFPILSVECLEIG